LGLYIPIRKIEENRRLIYGIAAAEEVDRAGEIFDYESSKPYVKAWSDEQAAQSGGQNYGNVRAMHGDISAGKIVAPITFDDEKKTVNVCIKVVDDTEWRKVLEGVYTGLSFGGHCMKTWQDGSAVRYTLKPSELSLADRPCVPSANIIEVVKADGSVRKVVVQGRNNMETNVKKMDLAEFGALISDVNAGLADDENVPQKLKDSVAQLAETIAECTDAAPEDLDAEKNDTAAKPDEDASAKDDPDTDEIAKIVRDAVQSAMKPVTETVKKLEEGLAEKEKEAGKLREKLEKIEKAAAPSRVVLKTDGWKLKKTEQDSGADDALAQIKAQHSGQKTWAYEA
jgi:hypothetical protein